VSSVGLVRARKSESWTLPKPNRVTERNFYPFSLSFRGLVGNLAAFMASEIYQYRGAEINNQLAP
jgi:hypothetical protein